MTLKIDPMHCKGSIRSNTRSEKRRCSCEIRFINSKLIEERMFLPQGPIMSQGHCRSSRCMRNFLRWPWLAKQKTNKKSGYQRMETTIAGNGFAQDHTLETAFKGTKLFSGTFPYHKPFCSFLWFQFFNDSTTKTAMRTKERRKNTTHKIGETTPQQWKKYGRSTNRLYTNLICFFRDFCTMSTLSKWLLPKIMSNVGTEALVQKPPIQTKKHWIQTHNT